MSSEDFDGHCPGCGSIHIRTTTTRLTDDAAIDTWECPECGERFEFQREHTLTEAGERFRYHVAQIFEPAMNWLRTKIET